MVAMREIYLIPRPQRYTQTEARFCFSDRVLIHLENNVRAVRPVTKGCSGS